LSDSTHFMEPEGSSPHSQEPATSPCAESDQSHPASLRYGLASSYHLLVGFPSGLFVSGLPTKTLYAPLLSVMRATCPAYLIFLDLIARIMFGEGYRSFKVLTVYRKCADSSGGAVFHERCGRRFAPQMRHTCWPLRLLCFYVAFVSTSLSTDTHHTSTSRMRVTK
jgi:hypothetical protein